MTPQSGSDPLRPMLAETEEELRHRLEDACKAQNVSAETTGELMRLEETLLDAAKVAKHAVSLRRRLRTMDEASPAEAATPSPPPRRATVHHPAEFHERFQASDTGPDSAPGTSSGDTAPTSDIAVRDLRDGRGVEWRVWEVIPKILGAKGSLGDRLGEYGEGWLAFESHSGTERRRLPHFPTGWRDLADSDLETLLDKADVVPVKRKGSSLDLPSPS